jgi:transketolase
VLTSANLEHVEVPEEDLVSLARSSLAIRETVLRNIHSAQSGHPGGSLSCIDILVALYDRVLRHDPARPDWPERDFFILSKGHAAPALYATLAHYGYFDPSILPTLRRLGSPLQGHPVRGNVPGVECSMGELGIGLPVGIGIGLGMKLDHKPNHVYVLLGDGECQEGSVWEAAMAASHYRLDNITAIIDRNGLQIDGSTEKVMGLEPLFAKWEAFGWQVIEIDGTDVYQVICALQTAKKLLRKPTAIIAYSVKGAGVQYMEHVQKFHGTPPTDDEYDEALRQLQAARETMEARDGNE